MGTGKLELGLETDLGLGLCYFRDILWSFYFLCYGLVRFLLILVYGHIMSQDVHRF